MQELDAHLDWGESARLAPISQWLSIPTFAMTPF